MAGTLTHYKVGKDIYKEIKAYDIDKDIYLSACQGHDLLYFIKLKDIGIFAKNRKKAEILQKSKFPLLCDKFLEYLRQNPEDTQVKSFFYGYLTHHLTDSIYHPFIHYFAHIVNDKKSKKYAGHHALLESVIDVLNYPDTIDVVKKMPKVKRNKRLENIVESIFYEVYGIKNMGKTLVKNMTNVRRFLRIYRVDKYKIKRIGYLIVQTITRKKIEYLSYNYPLKYFKITLDKKEVWLHPVTGKKHIDSLNDLAFKSEEKVIDTIKKLEKTLETKEKAKIDLDISANLGLKCDHQYKMKYFVD